MAINAPFYVMNEKDELVPAKFLVGPDGQYITNPNSSLNTINWRATRYFNADGSEIRNANPGNYLVVPYNYTLGHAMQFASDVNNAPSQGVSPNAMMLAAFIGKGSQNLQRTYQNADGSMTYHGDSVPMFQDAASFHLGLVSELTGCGPTSAQIGGSAYDLGAQGPNWAFGNIAAQKAWNNNARNMNSISGGADFANSYAPDPNPPFNPGGLLEQGYVPQSNISQDRNALNAFLNPSSGSIGKNALIF
jgi:hypothetical protein